MTSHRIFNRHWRLTLMVLAAIVVAVLIFGFQPTGTAQSQSAQLSLNSPVKFPGDI